MRCCGYYYGPATAGAARLRHVKDDHRVSLFLRVRLGRHPIGIVVTCSGSLIFFQRYRCGTSLPTQWTPRVADAHYAYAAAVGNTVSSPWRCSWRFRSGPSFHLPLGVRAFTCARCKPSLKCWAAFRPRLRILPLCSSRLLHKIFPVLVFICCRRGGQGV